MIGWHHQLNGHEVEQALGVGDGWTGKPGVLQSMGSQRVGHDWVTKLNSEMKKKKRELNNWNHTNAENHMKLLQTTIYQYNGQPNRNGQISRNVQSSKTESGRNKIWIDQLSVKKKLNQQLKNSQEAKVQDQRTSQVNSTKYLEKS